MTDFIRFGVLGDLRLGISRTEVLRRLGPPKEWNGKPPTVGRVINTPEEAAAWGYYGAARVSFNEFGISTSVSVTPSLVNSSEPPFKEWPIGPGATMGDFKRYLQQNGIAFYEELDPSWIYYIHHL